MHANPDLKIAFCNHVHGKDRLKKICFWRKEGRKPVAIDLWSKGIVEGRKAVAIAFWSRAIKEGRKPVAIAFWSKAIEEGRNQSPLPSEVKVSKKEGNQSPLPSEVKVSKKEGNQSPLHAFNMLKFLSVGKDDTRNKHFHVVPKEHRAYKARYLHSYCFYLIFGMYSGLPNEDIK